MAMRCNDLDLTHSLDGLWRFRLGDGAERDIVVPGAWEAATGDFLTDGPAVYTRDVTLGPQWAGRRIWLEFDAVSFAVDVFVNDGLAGAHRGMWSPFQIDLTAHWIAGANRLRLEVWKPGVRYPVREALAGFLPDVCTTFGGPWQSVRLRGAHVETPGLDDLCWTVGVDGSVTVSGAVLDPTPSDARLTVAIGARSSIVDLGAAGSRFTVTVPGAIRRRYGPAAPHLTPATLSLDAPDGANLARVSRRLGRRWFEARGANLRVNGTPAHLRGVLDWGWNPATVCPRYVNAGAQFARARELGFNLFKCCLYVPDEGFLDAADAAGMWIWLEMPLWLPAVTPALEALALAEYEAVFRRLHHHPCIAVVTLGCELNHASSVDFLRALDALARRYFPGALIGDNSGSAEAYGGVRADLGDVIDYHFYADPHFFGPLIDHFDRTYRRARPWLYGEFCDADTLRDFSTVRDAWWLNAPTPLERDDYLAQRDHAARFKAADVRDGGAALTIVGRKQATAIRKHILERVRRHNPTGGYVVTGWRDTPITTSGLVEDGLAHKFAPETWRRFNADRVLGLDRDRRRLWAGGDRPSPREPAVFWSRETAELHIVMANARGPAAAGQLSWSVTDEHGGVRSGVSATSPVAAGESRELCVLDLAMPAVTRPTATTLAVRWLGSDDPAQSCDNTWRLLTIPRPALPGVVAVEGLHAHRAALQALWPGTAFVGVMEAPATAPLLTDSTRVQFDAMLKQGRRVLLWLTEPDPRLTSLRPFWREAIHQVDFAALGLPEHDHADLTAHGVATDQALRIEGVATVLRAADIQVAGRPWRRFDARQFDWRDYWLEVAAGPGRCGVTTLRLAGGHGEQPAGLPTNPLGAWLLAHGLTP